MFEYIVIIINKIINNFIILFKVILESDNSLLDLERFGFLEPANTQMRCILEMFYFTAQTLFYILLFIIVTIWAIIGSRNNNIKYPINFTRWQEILIDIGVLFVPLIIIYYLTVPAVGHILYLDRYLRLAETIFTVEIVGHQWYWTYYLDSIQNTTLLEMYNIYNESSDLESILMKFDENSKIQIDQIMVFDTTPDKRCLLANQSLVLPVNHFIKVLITSADVIHSWTLPQLGIKVDAIPGRIQMFILNSDYCGTFYGQCSELCGVNHAFMPINVEFVLEDQFLDWYLKNLEFRPYKLILLDKNLKDLFNI